MKCMREWVNDCIKWHGRVLVGKHCHYCPEFDFLPVDMTCDEYRFCTCKRRDEDAVSVEREGEGQAPA
jgi:hypothetical protein